jgi:predicted nuclease with TOPRIM domain
MFQFKSITKYQTMLKEAIEHIKELNNLVSCLEAEIKHKDYLISSLQQNNETLKETLEHNEELSELRRQELEHIYLFHHKVDDVPMSCQRNPKRKRLRQLLGGKY